MDAIERLDIIEAVRTLKARYFRFIDTKQWDDFPSLFTEDVEIDVSDDVAAIGVDRARGRSTGRDQFARRVARLLEGVVTVHHGHMPEIDVLDPTHAHGIWAMYDRLQYPDGRLVTGAGHYDEDYRFDDGAWRIARMKLTRLYITTT